MKFEELPIGEFVCKCQTWDPRAEGKSDFQYIDLSSIDKDAKKITVVETLPCIDAPSRARQLVMTDDVLVATVRPNLNGVAHCNRIHDGMTASTGYCILRPRRDKLDSRYLFQWVKTETFVNRMVSVATGQSYPAVSDGKVKESTIPLPPLAEQKRIAGILDAADALRVKRREALTQLDTLLQSTFLDMFGDPVTNPKDWEIKQLGDSLHVKGGYAFKSAEYLDCEGAPLIRIGEVNRRNFVSQTLAQLPVHYFDKFKNFVVRDGAILMSLTGTVGKNDYGNAVTLRGDCERYLLNQRVAELIPSATLDPIFLRALLSQELVKRSLTGRSRGIRQANISNKDIQKLMLPLPPLNLQRRFAAIVNSLEQQKVWMRAHLAELDTLFASLQFRAFRGEL